MDDPNMTMEEYIKLEEEKARRRDKVYNWESATYGKICVAYGGGKVSLNNDEIDFRISFDESDVEDFTVIYDKNSFSYKIISINDLKTDSENDKSLSGKGDMGEGPNVFYPQPPSVIRVHDQEFNKEIFTPFEEPKRVFHSTRKLFKTTSLDYSSSLEFDLFSNLENQSEEEVTEAMAEPTMEEYMTKTREDYGSVIDTLLTTKLPSDRVHCPLKKIEANGDNSERRGDDEEVITDNELSNPKDENLTVENEIAQIFRIDTDLFHFETPLCQTFNEFNYLSQIDVNILTKYTPEFKTYEEYKDDWIYEWNDGMPWVNEKPWTNDGVWTETFDNIHHGCNPLRFKNGTAMWPTCNWNEDGYCNIGDLLGFIREGNSICYEDYEWYDTIEDSELKEEALINKAILEESMNMEEEYSDDAWSHYSSIDE
ncbi:hypothetical protein Tco_0215506 [Tanacetum coccineum]